MFLVGDIGGTNTRFALAERIDHHWRLADTQVRPTGPDVVGMVRQYLSDSGHPPLTGMACCGAGPRAADGRIRLTNADVLLEPEELAAAAGLPSAILVNDFAAVARAIPELPQDQLEALGGNPPRADSPCVIVGPGTGLGVAMLVPGGRGWVVVPGEGGHADLAPVDEAQAAAWKALRAAHGRVSAETVLSGPGLERLDAALNPGPARRAPEIAEAAWSGDARAQGTVRMFTRWLGSFAGNLALTAAAQGGVYIAGGILLAWGGQFDRRLFRTAFEGKPPYTDWLRGVPTCLVTHPQPGLYGLAAMAAEASLTSPP